MLDVGCGSGVLSVAAAKLGFGPVVGVRLRPAGGRGDERERGGQRRRRSRPRRPTLREDELPETDIALANIAAEAVARRSRRGFEAARRRSRPATSSSDDPQLARLPGRAPRPGRRLGSRSCHARSRVEFCARGELPRPLPRLQGLADRRAGGARAAARRRAREVDGRGDVAVVNTCCVTNEAVAKSRQAAARAARTHAARLRDRLRRATSDRAFAGLPAERHRRRAPDRGDAVETVAGDVGAIGCVQAEARLDRVRAFVKIQDGCSFSCAFCVIPLVRGGDAEPHAPTPCSGRSAGASRRGTARSSSPGSTSAASATAPPATRSPRLIRAAGAIAGARAAAALLDRGEPRRRRARRRAARDARRRRHLHVPLQSGDDGMLRAMARRYSVETYLRKLEPLGRLQPDRRRDRRLPRGGRARLRARRSRPCARRG